MLIKGLNSEDFTNYKKTSMFIIFPHCSFKCEKECGIKCCQNSDLAKMLSKEVSVDTLVNHYISNPITHAVVCGGLEPFDSWEDLLNLVKSLRDVTSDDIVIFTGYNEDEIEDKLHVLRSFKNILVKFGRFKPHDVSRYDEVLGITLASQNQYAKKIS